MSFRPSVICADIGSIPKGNFGWYSDDGTAGDDASSLARFASSLLTRGRPLALGFECPLFVFLHDEERNLTSARPGEGSRAWSAGAGCGALATGLAQVPWVLSKVREQLQAAPMAYLSWAEFEMAQSGILLWEAFVSGGSKTGSHRDDAQLAVQAFLAALPDPRRAQAIAGESPVYSFAGAALLRTGWSSDLTLLQKACLVIKG